MKEAVLDGRSFDDEEQLHKLLKGLLALPDYYGNNLDALWDLLTGWVEMPLTLTWTHYAESERKLGDYSARLRELFEEAERDTNGFRFILSETS